MGRLARRIPGAMRSGSQNRLNGNRKLRSSHSTLVTSAARTRIRISLSLGSGAGALEFEASREAHNDDR